MTNFIYKGRDKSGALSSGQMEAGDSKAVARELVRQGLTPVSIRPGPTESFSPKIDAFLLSLQSVSANEIIVFTRQLASVLKAGVPLVEGLAALQEQITNNYFKDIIAQVKKDIESGAAFSEALSKHPRVFSKLAVNMVKAGEKAGILEDVLERVSNLLEKDFETVNRIKSATRYPIMVLAAMFLAFMALTTWIIPRFAAFFANFKAELPLPTRVLIGANHFVVNYWLWVLLGAAGAVYLWKRFLATARGRHIWDRFILSAPIFGPLFLKVHLSRFSRMLSAMVRSGIPILQALSITAETVESRVIAGAILEIKEKVNQGSSLSEPMRRGGVFPPIAVSMVAIGEKAGTLDVMLDKLADYFDSEADYTVKNLTPLLEPILIFGLGMIMLVFALGIFLPMWELIRAVRH